MEQRTPEIVRRTNRERSSMTASSKAAGGLGSSGMVKLIKSLINVVSPNRPKLLIGLNQNGMQLDNFL